MRNFKSLLLVAVLLFSLPLAAQTFYEGGATFTGSSTFNAAKTAWYGAPGHVSMLPIMQNPGYNYSTTKFLSHVVVRQSVAWETPTNFVSLRPLPLDSGGPESCPRDIVPNCVDWDLSVQYTQWLIVDKTHGLNVLNQFHPLQQPWVIGPIELPPAVAPKQCCYPTFRYVILFRALNVRCGSGPC